MQTSQPRRRSLLATLFISPNEPRLRAGWRILAHLMLLTALVTLGSILAAPVLLSNSQTAWVLGQGIVLVAITMATFIARRWIDRRSFASLGLRWDRQAGRDLALGILLPALQMGMIFAIEWGLGWLQIEQWRPASLQPGVVFQELGIAFLVFVFVGWQEELLSRGYWLQNLIDGMGLPGALAISSLAFALAHLANPNVSVLSILGLTAAGLFLAYGYLATRQLWLPIGLHIGWNFFEGPIFGFPVSGTTQFFSLLQTTRNGPEWLTGGAFGPEAGLIQYPALLIAIWIIYRYSRRYKNRTP